MQKKSVEFNLIGRYITYHIMVNVYFYFEQNLNELIKIKLSTAY